MSVLVLYPALASALDDLLEEYGWSLVRDALAEISEEYEEEDDGI